MQEAMEPLRQRQAGYSLWHGAEGYQQTVVKDCGFKVFSDAVAEAAAAYAASMSKTCGSFQKGNRRPWVNLSKTYGAKGLAWINMKEEGVNSPIAKFLSEDELQML